MSKLTWSSEATFDPLTSFPREQALPILLPVALATARLLRVNTVSSSNMVLPSKATVNSRATAVVRPRTAARLEATLLLRASTADRDTVISSSRAAILLREVKVAIRLKVVSTAERPSTAARILSSYSNGSNPWTLTGLALSQCRS